MIVGLLISIGIGLAIAATVVFCCYAGQQIVRYRPPEDEP